MNSRNTSESTTILVTGVGGGGLGEQIVKALRLAEGLYRIIGTDTSPISKGLGDVDVPYLLPRADNPAYVDALLDICREEQVKAVFHGSEPELRALSAARGEFASNGLFLPINPDEVIDLCMDKVRTCSFLRRNGFLVPAYLEIASVDDLDAVDFFPAVLKPSTDGGGSANLYLAQTREELQTFGRYLLSLVPRFIVQEYVGTPEQEFTVGVLLDMEGNLLNSIALRRTILASLGNRLKVKNRTGREDLGPVLAISSGISQGEIGRFPEVTVPCERMALALGCRGAVNIQCRLVAGKVYVFEINPRFSGTTSLRALAGYNEPDVLIRRHLFGESILPGFAYRSGWILRGLAESFVDPQQVRGREFG